MASSQRVASYGKLFVLCCIFLGSVVANVNVNELPHSSYAVWGSALADRNNIVEFNPMTGEAGQVVLKNDNKYMAGVAPAVNPATKTLYWPIVELESGRPGKSQLAVVNTTSKPWVITRRITVGHSGTHSVEHAFFDPVHQHVWLFAVGIGQRSEHLLSVYPETNTYKKIDLYSLLPNSSQGALSAVFNPETRGIVMSIHLLKGNGAVVPAIAMFDIDREIIAQLSANEEMTATALVWDSDKKEIYSFLTPVAPPPNPTPTAMYGRVDSWTGAITPLLKYDSSHDGMGFWCNPLYHPSSRSVIAVVAYNGQNPAELTVFEPTTGRIKFSSTYNDTDLALRQMFNL